MSRSSVQLIMQRAPRGQPIDTRMLADLGISPAKASRLAGQGWLQRLGRGAYLLTADQLTPDGIVAFLGRRTPGLHIGGKTALDRQGIRHNVAMRDRLTLWSPVPIEIPQWAKDRAIITCQSTALFDDGMAYKQHLRTLPGGHPEVLVSCRERATLELVSDVGRGQSLEEVRNLFVGLRDIRPAVMAELLEHCHRVKVVRLVRDLAQQEGYAWASIAQARADALSGGKRWSMVGRDGERLTLKP